MNFNKYHVSRNLFDLATAEDTNIYITNNGREAEATNGDRFIAQQFMTTPSTQYTFSWADTILGTDNNSPYIRVSEYNGNSFVKRTIYLCSDYPNKVITIMASSSTDTFDIRYDSSTSDRGQTITNLMANSGSTPLPYEPYSTEVWHDIPYYIHKTDTDTITTLPADLYADGNNATVGLVGNMSQTGTPTPQNPIQPQETGERTGNLLNLQEVADAYPNDVSFDGITLDIYGGITNLFNRGITVDFPSGCYFSCIPLEKENASTNGRVRFIYTDDTVKEVYITKSDGTPSVGRGEIEKPVKSLRFNWSSFNSGFKFKLAILNTGSTALPYEPYGIKIPILSANTTTPVYLGEVEATRRVRKWVLKGDEDGWFYSSGFVYNQNITPDYLRSSAQTVLCSHFKAIPNVTAGGNVGDGECALYSVVGVQRLYFRDSNYTTSVSDFKTYLQQQYANGTPVVVYYVLATPTTGIVNEPLRKIGDYADTVSDITIPTITGKDTFDILTTLKPSEVTANYHGWHTGAVHERESGSWD